MRRMIIIAGMLLALVAAMTFFRPALGAAKLGATSMEGTVRAPEFPQGFAWLNTDKPLRFSDELKGQIVVLDFWTYCCINCMHVLPDLARLEEKFKDQPVVIIGVHSNKFDNEGSLANIRAAVQRYEVTHPVVVDENMRIWKDFTINSWPTLVLVGANGKIIGAISGEGHYEILAKSIEGALAQARARNDLAAAPLKLSREGAVRSASGLSFPGKVLADEKGQRLFIADSNHNRILITDLPDNTGNAHLLEIIGEGAIGADDGPFDKARFHRPQGLALAGDTLWIADTENHLIRAADLAKKQVRTVLGTGKQVFDPEAGKTGRAQGLNSPWDLAAQGTKLYISMAGQHQLFVMNTLTAMAEIYAGSGRENIRDGLAADANLAQPSGLALDPARSRLYFADSEVSAIRYVDMKAARIQTVIGHGLFEFGDVDGNAEKARLQHCLGVAVLGDKLLVADTYNHKIKLLDPEARSAATFAGTGTPGAGTPGGPVAFFEPASVTVAGDHLYVSDTNNHRLVMIDQKTKAWREVMIAGLAPAPLTAEAPPDAHDLGPIKIPATDVTLAITPTIPAAAHLTPGSPISLKLTIANKPAIQQTLSDAPALPLKFALPAAKLAPGPWTITLYYATCTDGPGSVCQPAKMSWKLQTTIADGATPEVSLK